MAMLQGRLSLFDVRDVELFCEHAISRSQITEFGYLDREDLLAELVEFVWQISLDYDASRASFSTYAGHRCRRFVVDWKRSDYRTRWAFRDRVYERARPVFVGLEHRPDEADRAEPLDLATSGLPALLGLDRSGDRAAVRRDRALGHAPGRCAA